MGCGGKAGRILIRQRTWSRRRKGGGAWPRSVRERAEEGRRGGAGVRRWARILIRQRTWSRAAGGMVAEVRVRVAEMGETRRRGRGGRGRAGANLDSAENVVAGGGKGAERGGGPCADGRERYRRWIAGVAGRGDFDSAENAVVAAAEGWPSEAELRARMRESATARGRECGRRVRILIRQRSPARRQPNPRARCVRGLPDSAVRASAVAASSRRTRGQSCRDRRRWHGPPAPT